MRADGTASHIAVIETNGDHLDNLDTAYKRAILSFLSGSCASDDCTNSGELKLFTDNSETVQCALILMSEWETKLPKLLNRNSI